MASLLQIHAQDMSGLEGGLSQTTKCGNVDPELPPGGLQLNDPSSALATKEMNPSCKAMLSGCNCQ